MLERRETRQVVEGMNSFRDKLGYATVPLQKAKIIYNLSTALAYGTLFPELNIPWGEYGPKEIFEG